MVLGVGVLLRRAFGGPVGLNAQQSTGAAVRIDNDDIGGVVTSANGRKPASG